MSHRHTWFHHPESIFLVQWISFKTTTYPWTQLLIRPLPLCQVTIPLLGGGRGLKKKGTILWLFYYRLFCFYYDYHHFSFCCAFLPFFFAWFLLLFCCYARAEVGTIHFNKFVLSPNPQIARDLSWLLSLSNFLECHVGYNLLSGRENSEPDMLFTSRSPSLNGESVLTYTIHGHLPTCSSNVSRQREKNPFTESFACAVTEKKIAIHNEHNPFSENFARAIAESNSGLSDHAESQASSSESRQQSNSKDFIKKQSKKRSSQQLSTTELDSSPSKHAKPAKVSWTKIVMYFSPPPPKTPWSGCRYWVSLFIYSWF